MFDNSYQITILLKKKINPNFLDPLVNDARIEQTIDDKKDVYIVIHFFFKWKQRFNLWKTQFNDRYLIFDLVSPEYDATSNLIPSVLNTCWCFSFNVSANMTPNPFSSKQWFCCVWLVVLCNRHNFTFIIIENKADSIRQKKLKSIKQVNVK